MSTPYLQEVAAREAKSRSDAKKGCTVLLVLGVAIFSGGIWLLSGRTSPEEQATKRREQLRYSAQVAAIQEIERRARDPESVQTRNLVTVVRDSTWVVCGEYNAKNGFGGYAGFQEFAVDSKGEFATPTQNSAAYAIMLRLCVP